jgi:hypothetical protein
MAGQPKDHGSSGKFELLLVDAMALIEEWMKVVH